MAAGAFLSGIFPLVMATIPSEVVGLARTTTALSLTMGISEIVGGVFAPWIAGRVADRMDWGPRCGYWPDSWYSSSCWRWVCVRRRQQRWRAGQADAGGVKSGSWPSIATDLSLWRADVGVAEQDHPAAGRFHRPRGTERRRLRAVDCAGDGSLCHPRNDRWFVHRSHRRAHGADRRGRHRRGRQRGLSPGAVHAGVPGTARVRGTDHGLRLLGGAGADHVDHFRSASRAGDGALVHVYAGRNFLGAGPVGQLRRHGELARGLCDPRGAVPCARRGKFPASQGRRCRPVRDRDRPSWMRTGRSDRYVFH